MELPPGPLPAGQSRPALVAEVARTLARFAPEASVVVACSGGPDSTALAHLVHDARPDLEVCLGHVRHGLRDDWHDLDVATTHAAWLGLPLLCREVEVVPDGKGLEAAARDVRHAALRDIAEERGASAVLLGHTADDQAETLLLRLARGTGLDGLAGMDAEGERLVRPLLRLRREDVRRFVEFEGLPVAHDPTNDDREVRRAVVRHDVLPVLARVAGDPVGALGRLADLVRDDTLALDRAAGEGLAAVVRVGPVRAVADACLADLVDRGGGTASLARRVVRAVIGELTGLPPDASTVARILALPTGSAATLPGPVEVTAAGGWYAFAPRTLPVSDPVPVAVPGGVTWAPAGSSVVAVSPQQPDPRPSVPHNHGSFGGQISFALPGVWTPPPAEQAPALLPPGAVPGRLVLALSADVGPLWVRHRRAGDRINTAGGTRSLQDVLVDAGVPRAVRDLWPVIVDDDDRPLWSPGYAADEATLRAGRRAPAAQLRVCAA